MAAIQRGEAESMNTLLKALLGLGISLIALGIGIGLVSWLSGEPDGNISGQSEAELQDMRGAAHWSVEECIALVAKEASAPIATALAPSIQRYYPRSPTQSELRAACEEDVAMQQYSEAGRRVLGAISERRAERAQSDSSFRAIEQLRQEEQQREFRRQFQ